MTRENPAQALMHKATRLLARRAHSRGELHAKLAKSADPADLEAVLDRLEELGLLNDAEYAYNFASSRIRERSWGSARVYQALLRRKVPAAVAARTMERIRGETDDRALIETYLERYWRTRSRPRNRAELSRLIGHLSRRGYGDELIIDVLHRRVPAEAWRDFESD
ncbi:MAG: regulatory protein RecX [Acidobacteria bacterium]|nr:regulatory protein RecX [Acidobacteriota bacterium]